PLALLRSADILAASPQGIALLSFGLCSPSPSGWRTGKTSTPTGLCQITPQLSALPVSALHPPPSIPPALPSPNPDPPSAAPAVFPPQFSATHPPPANPPTRANQNIPKTSTSSRKSSDVPPLPRGQRI